jgi:hypothetical protein
LLPQSGDPSPTPRTFPDSATLETSPKTIHATFVTRSFKETKMKITHVLLICLCCVMIVPAVCAQAGKSPSKAGILGYLDPVTGAFRPVPAVADDSTPPPALTTYGGTITVTLTITVKSTNLTSFTCTAEVSVEDEITTTPRGYEETGTAAATGSGSTRTCVVTIPYSWALGTQSSDSMSISYGVFGSAAAPAVAQRTSGLSPLDTTKVPTSGTTTALTADVTL